jgi:hypothetical protein
MIPKLLIAMATLPGFAAAQDAAEIVRKAVDQYSRNQETLQNYTYKDRTITRDLDGKGHVKGTHSTLSEIMFINGKQLTRTLEIDGKPAPHEANKEERARQRASNNPLKYVPLAYDLKIVGQPEINGRASLTTARMLRSSATWKELCGSTRRTKRGFASKPTPAIPFLSGYSSPASQKEHASAWSESA